MASWIRVCSLFSVVKKLYFTFISLGSNLDSAHTSYMSLDKLLELLLGVVLKIEWVNIYKMLGTFNTLLFVP